MEKITKRKSVFETLYAIDCSQHTETKNNLTYLSWAWAWTEVASIYPEAKYEYKWFDDGTGVLKPYFYEENMGFMVQTSIEIEGIEREMMLPVMDNANKPLMKKAYTYKKKNWSTGQFYDATVKAITMFDINTAIMRCLTKNIAMFGLGLYIYAGEDIPKELAKVQEMPIVKQEPIQEAVQDVVEEATKGAIATKEQLGFINQFMKLSEKNSEYVKKMLGGDTSSTLTYAKAKAMCMKLKEIQTQS